MHVDLNSCFATAEQQANPLLRGKPLGVAAYDSPGGCIVAPSIEAKRLGIKTGMRIREAHLLCPDLIIRTPDPEKYRDIHMKFRKIFQTYSDKVTPKSIDEAIIDFRSMEGTNIDLVKVGYEIKKRMRSEIGDWMSCNVGIGTNRFLAKTAAGLHKPDGLDVITHQNLIQIYESLDLIDLCGINTRYQARLNSYNIFTPIDFLNAESEKLHKLVFKSIVGKQWYERLRGYETDDVEFTTKNIGQMYSLKKPTNEKKELGSILMKLCEKSGRRLRKQGYVAHGIHVSCIYDDWTHWHRGRLMSSDLYTTNEIYKAVWYVLNQQPIVKKVAKIAMSCYGLQKKEDIQPTLFEDGNERHRKASDAMDAINDRFGEFIVTPGIMMGMKDVVVDRVAFGGVKELEDLYLNNTA